MKKLIIFFIISFILAVLNGYFFNYINDAYLHFNVNYNKHQNISKNELNFIAICIAPILETLIFQHILYLILKKIKIQNDVICIVVMSVVFSSMHHYNWLYIVMTFFGGLILNNLYVYYYKHNNKYSFILTVFFHSLFNLYGFLFIM
ncbi:CPBP family intramembrane glutamic endopeptidase [uncultured Chryseobacterium sp.]|uniref:CPBP family intramembrane glutamic endopeptidase n=1 Tax=uncultured Chryseobacterium sp. TaxID=259322 RepID=UPI00338E7BD5